MNYSGRKNLHLPKALTIFENLTVFLMGAVVYFGTEFVYRGYSHITMFFAGGICFFLIYVCEKHIVKMKLLYRCVLYAFMITAVEFVFGLVFNVWLGLNVWDYSEEPFNILGQVCPGFVLIWMALSLPAVWLSGKVRRFFIKMSKKLM